MSSVNALTRLVILFLAISSSMVTYIVIWRSVYRKLEDAVPLKVYDSSIVFTSITAIGSWLGFTLWDFTGIGDGSLLAHIGFGIASWFGGVISVSLLELLCLTKECKGKR